MTGFSSLLAAARGLFPLPHSLLRACVCRKVSFCLFCCYIPLTLRLYIFALSFIVVLFVVGRISETHPVFTGQRTSMYIYIFLSFVEEGTLPVTTELNIWDSKTITILPVNQLRFPMYLQYIVFLLPRQLHSPCLTKWPSRIPSP